MTNDTRTDIRGMTLVRIVKSTHITNQRLEEVHHRMYGNGSPPPQRIIEPPEGYYLSSVDVIYNNGASGIEIIAFSADELVPLMDTHLRLKKEETYSQEEGKTVVVTEHTLVVDGEGTLYSKRVKHELNTINFHL